MTPNSVPEWTKPLYLYGATALKLQPQQVIGMCKRTLKERLASRIPVDIDSYYEQSVPMSSWTQHRPLAENNAVRRSCLDESARRQHRKAAQAAANGTVRFMNHSLQIGDGASLEWYDDRFEELPLLWRLKLYAFEPLDDVVFGVDPQQEMAQKLRDQFDGWIRNWIENVEIGRPRYLRRAWTPWAVSLRLQRWIRYAAWRQSVSGEPTANTQFETAFSQELYKNAVFLRNHIEWDVGGNHLVENGIALLVAGLFYADTDSDWADVGSAILRQTASRQFLDDGCHYERSPMYHILTLTRLLTACDLLERYDRTVPGQIETTTAKATGFLQALRPPNGRIPLLNDAVYGQALPIGACLRYATATGISTGYRECPHQQDTLGESGYRWLRTDSGAMLFDGGPTGPPHLPGHSHSDTLSVLLWLDDRPIITDTGTYSYVSGERRSYARGVGSHSTVQVDSVEPIEIGGKYLMGERPTPQLRTAYGDISLVEARYDSASPFGPSYTHHRAVYAGDDWWFVYDTVTGHRNAPVTSRLMLHPLVDPSVGEPIALEVPPDELTGYLYPVTPAQTDIANGYYYPRFGTEITRPVVELSTNGSPIATIGMLLTQEELEAVDLRTDGQMPTAIETPDGTYQLPGSRLLPEV